MVVLVSDFIAGGKWENSLARLARRHTFTRCWYDPLDEGLQQLGLVDVVDAETGQTRCGCSLFRHADVRRRPRGCIARAGAKAVSISTLDDPYTILARHFQSRGRNHELGAFWFYCALSWGSSTVTFEAWVASQPESGVGNTCGAD